MVPSYTLFLHILQHRLMATIIVIMCEQNVSYVSYKNLMRHYLQFADMVHDQKSKFPKGEFQNSTYQTCLKTSENNNVIQCYAML